LLSRAERSRRVTRLPSPVFRLPRFEAPFCGAGSFARAPGAVRLTNPMTASSDTFSSNPAARARSRQASTRASSATAAAMASESSLAIRFTTSSILGPPHRRRIWATGASLQPKPAPGGRLRRSAKCIHVEGVTARDRRTHCKLGQNPKSMAGAQDVVAPHRFVPSLLQCVARSGFNPRVGAEKVLL
jgi:hypothetical protein